MTAALDTPTGLLGRLNAMPTALRWMMYAAIGVLVMAIVQSPTDTDLLTKFGTTQAMLKWSMPILIAGIGGLFSERAGVVNIGLEGMMILGTWFGAWGAVQWGPWGGLAAALVAGGLGGLLHAVATVNFGVDQIVSGVAINILAPGLTRYLSEEILVNYEGGSQTQSPRVDGLGNITMPFLAGGNIGSWKSPDPLKWLIDQEWFWISDMAGVLRGLMVQVSYFTILGLLLALGASWLLWNTRFGLRLRSAGENPFAGESLGVDIYRYKYAGVIISGALAGAAGAFIVLELTGLYRGGQTGGRGFIALAALIFGNYRVAGILAGSLLFAYPLGLSFADFDGNGTRALLLLVVLGLLAMSIFSATRARKVDASIAGVLAVTILVWFFLMDDTPDWLPNTMPYALVLLVLIFNVQKLRTPKFVGIPYRRGDG